MQRLTGRVGAAARFVAQNRLTILALAAIWAIGVGAFVVVHQSNVTVDREVKAQLANGKMQRELGDLTLIAVAPVFLPRAVRPSVDGIRLQLKDAERGINTTSSALGRYDTANELAPIVSGERLYFAEIAQIATLFTKGRLTAGVSAFGRSYQPTGNYGKLIADMRRLSAADSRQAAHARATRTTVEVFAFAILLLAFSGILGYTTHLSHARRRLLELSQVDASTDALTGLPNRRKLFTDMKALLAESPPPTELALGMFDLDGFKHYNDTFGHPAGDALLVRLSHKLAAATEGHGAAYRMGGDEFCVIIRGAGAEGILSTAAEALSEHGESFSVHCSYGSVVVVPGELTLEQALQQADQRLYDNKPASPTHASREAYDVLLQVLAEQHFSLSTHLITVGRLAEAVARKLGLPEDQITLTRLTGELHDIGKTAIPDAILNKPGPLDQDEWTFMKRHTIIGERILAAAPALTAIAPLVRSSHERLDGTGYPDGLRADEIPISSRIVAVVDAYHAMTIRRPYRLPRTLDGAIDELRRCAGSQFDPTVTEAFVAILRGSIRKLPARRSPAPAMVAA